MNGASALCIQEREDVPPAQQHYRRSKQDHCEKAACSRKGLLALGLCVRGNSIRTPFAEEVGKEIGGGMGGSVGASSAPGGYAFGRPPGGLSGVGAGSF